MGTRYFLEKRLGQMARLTGFRRTSPLRDCRQRAGEAGSRRAAAEPGFGPIVAIVWDRRPATVADFRPFVARLGFRQTELMVDRRPVPAVARCRRAAMRVGFRSAAVA
jgi:hypothetical protein